MDENKKPETPPEPQPGFPQKKIVYAVLAVAIVILSVVLIAKFGYNTDMLNPSGGQMSLAQRNLSYKVTPLVQRVITPFPRLSPCAVNQSTDCNGACRYLMTDNKNCGTCGNSCSRINSCKTGNCSCSNGNCVSDNNCEGVVCQDGETVCCNGRCVRIDVPHTCGGYPGA
jgi:hypothetical protein